MRHYKNHKKLNMTCGHRRSLFLNLIRSMFVNKGIKTTLAKGKAVKPLIEKIITRVKKGQIDRSSLLKKYVRSSSLREKIIEIANSYSTRNGGYVRLLKLYYRQGDASAVVQLMFT